MRLYYDRGQLVTPDGEPIEGLQIDAVESNTNAPIVVRMTLLTEGWDATQLPGFPPVTEERIAEAMTSYVKMGQT